MITEIVLFDLPKGITREAMIAQFRESIPRWQQNPDMIRKHMIFDLASGKGGGIYLWKCVEDAQRWHDESFRQRVLSAFGSEPSYQYFDTPVIVDNAARYHDRSRLNSSAFGPPRPDIIRTSREVRRSFAAA